MSVWVNQQYGHYQKKKLSWNITVTHDRQPVSPKNKKIVIKIKLLHYSTA